MSLAPHMQVDILPDAAALAHRVAEWMTEIASAKAGRIAIALAGGSTPRPVYESLASPPIRARFPWARCHWFWGDERFVPRNDPRSNYRMAREAMLSRVDIPAANIHPIPTEQLTASEAAARYERELKSFYGAAELVRGRVLFDLTLLGLGADGHTASLFPNSPVLEERSAWVAPSHDPSSEPRITLTYPVLESSAQLAFLVSGREKRCVLNRLRSGDRTIPAGRIHPLGALRLFIDADAATKG